MCTVLLPPGVNPIAVNKYIYIYNLTKNTTQYIHPAFSYIFRLFFLHFSSLLFKKISLECFRYGWIYTPYPRFYILVYLVVWKGRGWRRGTRLRTEERNCIVTTSISTSGLPSRHYNGKGWSLTHYPQPGAQIKQ